MFAASKLNIYELNICKTGLMNRIYLPYGEERRQCTHGMHDCSIEYCGRIIDLEIGVITVWTAIK